MTWTVSTIDFSCLFVQLMALSILCLKRAFDSIFEGKTKCFVSNTAIMDMSVCSCSAVTALVDASVTWPNCWIITTSNCVITSFILEYYSLYLSVFVSLLYCTTIFVSQRTRTRLLPLAFAFLVSLVSNTARFHHSVVIHHKFNDHLLGLFNDAPLSWWWLVVVRSNFVSETLNILLDISTSENMSLWLLTGWLSIKDTDDVYGRDILRPSPT